MAKVPGANWGHDKFGGAAAAPMMGGGQTEVMVSNLARSVTNNDVKVCYLSGTVDIY